MDEVLLSESELFVSDRAAETESRSEDSENTERLPFKFQLN